MIIQCNKCQKQYKVNPDKITEKGTKITCPACGHNFIVRRKAEAPPPPKMKTPPCQVCGQPSTRVLKGNPPHPLCERCFQVEKEKQTRFSPEAFQPAPVPETPAERPEPTEAPPGPQRKMIEEGEYFDTFDEIPDIPSEEDQVPIVSASEAKEFKPRQEAPPAKPEPPATDPFAQDRSTFVSEEREQPAPPPTPAQPPAPATARPPAPTPAFDFPEDDVPMPPQPPPAKPLKPAPGVSPAPAAPLPAQGRFSLEEEVERSLEQDKVQVAEAPAESPAAAVPAAVRKHWPAYAVSAGVIILVLLAAAYSLLRQRAPGPQASQSAPAAEPQPGEERVAAAPEPSPTPAPPPVAPTAQPPKPEVAGQVANKLKLYRAFFQLDTIEGYQKALRVLDQAQALDPQNAEIEALRIETHAFMASLTDNFLYTRLAKKLLNQASPAAQAEPAYKRSQIHVFLIDRDTPAARTSLEDYQAQYPNDGLGFYLLGLSYLKEKPPDFPAARENFEKAVNLDPTLTRAYLELGNIDRSFRKLDEALAAFRQVHKLSPLKNEADTAITELEDEIKKKSEAAAAAPAPTPVSVPLPTAPQPVPGATGGQPAAAPVPSTAPLPTKPAAGPAPVSVLEASGDALSDNLREIISEVSRPMSRVPAQPKTPVEKAQPPPPPPKTVPPEERPSQ
jgi:predicted Zn finger-like uncharacterized protein